MLEQNFMSGQDEIIITRAVENINFNLTNGGFTPTPPTAERGGAPRNAVERILAYATTPCAPHFWGKRIIRFLYSEAEFLEIFLKCLRRVSPHGLFSRFFTA